MFRCFQVIAASINLQHFLFKTFFQLFLLSNLIDHNNTLLIVKLVGHLSSSLHITSILLFKNLPPIFLVISIYSEKLIICTIWIHCLFIHHITKCLILLLCNLSILLCYFIRFIFWTLLIISSVLLTVTIVVLTCITYSTIRFHLVGLYTVELTCRQRISCLRNTNCVLYILCTSKNTITPLIH